MLRSLFVEQALDTRWFDPARWNVLIGVLLFSAFLVINLFRDRAAMDAFQAYSNAKIAEVEAMNPGFKVPAGDVYPEVIALL